MRTDMFTHIHPRMSSIKHTPLIVWVQSNLCTVHIIYASMGAYIYTQVHMCIMTNTTTSRAHMVTLSDSFPIFNHNNTHAILGSWTENSLSRTCSLNLCTRSHICCYMCKTDTRWITWNTRDMWCEFDCCCCGIQSDTVYAETTETDRNRMNSLI